MQIVIAPRVLIEIDHLALILTIFLAPFLGLFSAPLERVGILKGRRPARIQ
jgi:hypothetical protein